MSLDHSPVRQERHVRYLNRKEQVEYLRARGLPMTVASLDKRATLGGGPRYAIFNGRAFSTEAWLDEYIAERMSTPRHTTSELEA